MDWDPLQYFRRRHFGKEIKETFSVITRYRSRKKAKILLQELNQDYHGDFHNIYVTFDGASKFSTFEAVSSTGHEKNRYFTPKKHINSNKKNITKIYQLIF